MKKCLCVISFLFLAFAPKVLAASFYVDSGYDVTGRTQLNAILISESSKAYFYADESWWNFAPQSEILEKLKALGTEFDSVIYPGLTSVYGTEWNPGIDKDSKITILIEPMKNNFGGYFRSNDEYPKIQINDSNEKEMIYLNSDNLKSELIKSLLAHEFVHLITFNQKENIYNAVEDVWLNEARAQYAPTLLGYDNNFSGSNLEKAIQIFKENPSDSLVEWSGKSSDYGSATLFINYLVDQYGVNILTDSLHSSRVGIDSLNYALQKEGSKDLFQSVFKNWLVAVLINDCTYGKKYCYSNSNFSDFHLVPQINFLPVSGESTLTFSDEAKEWSGSWYKIIGGKGTLDFKFSAPSPYDFAVPYLIQNKSGNYSINFLNLDASGKGEAVINNFGTEAVSLFVISSVLGPKEAKPSYSFSWSVSTQKSSGDPNLISSLLAQISQLQSQIAALKAQLAAISNQTCKITNNLYFGLQNEEVKCLQRFLNIPTITGYFGSITNAAVIKFQIQNNLPATGYVGPLTRAKISS